MKKSAPFLILVLLLAVSGWYFFTREPDPAHQLPQALTPPPVQAPAGQAEPEPEVVTALPEPEPYSEPEETPEPLPLLRESDDAIKPALAEIAGSDLVGQYLVRDQVISRFVATLDSLTSRQVPPPVNPVKPVAGEFIVGKQGDRIILSPRNFARYEPYLRFLEAVNTPSLMSAYQRFAPLFQQAWEENGQQGSFDARMVEVIDMLIDTPDVPGPVYLTKPEAVYLYEDPVLEGLTAGQKILVRMGSANAALVKARLIEIREVLANRDL